METKHSVWRKLAATASALGALLLSAGPAQAGSDTVTLGVLGQSPGLAVEGVKRVGFTAHSYVAYAASDITSVYPTFGTVYDNVATANCGWPGGPNTVSRLGRTNLVDGDIWYVGCLGIYTGLTVTVTAHP